MCIINTKTSICKHCEKCKPSYHCKSNIKSKYFKIGTLIPPHKNEKPSLTTCLKYLEKKKTNKTNEIILESDKDSIPYIMHCFYIKNIQNIYRIMYNIETYSCLIIYLWNFKDNKWIKIIKKNNMELCINNFVSKNKLFFLITTNKKNSKISLKNFFINLIKDNKQLCKKDNKQLCKKDNKQLCKKDNKQLCKKETKKETKKEYKNKLDEYLCKLLCKKKLDKYLIKDDTHFSTTLMEFISIPKLYYHIKKPGLYFIQCFLVVDISCEANFAFFINDNIIKEISGTEYNNKFIDISTHIELCEDDIININVKVISGKLIIHNKILNIIKM